MNKFIILGFLYLFFVFFLLKSFGNIPKNEVGQKYSPYDLSLPKEAGVSAQIR